MTRPQSGPKTGLIIKVLLPLYVGMAIMFAVLIKRGHMQLLDPAGMIASYQSKVLWGALIFAAVVGITIVTLFFVVIFRYREDNHRTYHPTSTTSNKVQLLTWSVLSVIILVICFGVWSTTHTIDPYIPIASTKRPVTVQAVALRWKWLFIYPDSGIATTNFLEVPTGTPINLELTADAPMSSFWVPQLSGQVYAMPGMITQLHLQADKAGTFAGTSPEINGDGYADMTFTVKAVPMTEYHTWLSSTAKQAAKPLDFAAYKQLAQPSIDSPQAVYQATDPGLFHEIMMQFMAPGINSAELQIGGKQL